MHFMHGSRDPGFFGFPCLLRQVPVTRMWKVWGATGLKRPKRHGPCAPSGTPDLSGLHGRQDDVVSGANCRLHVQFLMRSRRGAAVQPFLSDSQVPVLPARGCTLRRSQRRPANRTRRATGADDGQRGSWRSSSAKTGRRVSRPQAIRRVRDLPRHADDRL